MASLRLKVQYGEENGANSHYHEKNNATLKFVYVLECPSNKTIEDLLRLLEKYLRQEFCWNHLQLVQLMTNDRFLLGKSDLCTSVLKDNDHLICIDMATFARNNYQSLDLDNLWLELKEHDATDNMEKYIQVGLTDRSKLFIRMHGGGEMYALYLFTIYDLLKIAHEKRRGDLILI